MLLVEVLASGRVGKVEIETSSGYDILDEAAVKAVRRWRFTPAKKGRRPVSAWVRIPVEFDLRSDE
jgi:protein TonB